MTRIPKEHFTICFENIFLVQGMTNKSHEIFTKRNNWIQQRVVSRIRLYFCFILIVFYSYSATPWQHTRRELSLPRLWLVSDIDSFFFFSKVDWKLVISIHQVIAFTMTWLLPLWCCFLIFFIYFFLLFFFLLLLLLLLNWRCYCCSKELPVGNCSKISSLGSSTVKRTHRIASSRSWRVSIIAIRMELSTGISRYTSLINDKHYFLLAGALTPLESNQATLWKTLQSCQFVRYLYATFYYCVMTYSTM